MPPLDTAVYWTEYVIRHEGAPHLRTAAVHMPWRQYLLLDVIALLILAIVATLFTVYCFAKFVIGVARSLMYRPEAPSKSDNKVKEN